MDNKTESQPSIPVVRRNIWLKVLGTAAVIYILLLLALLLTKNPNIFPTLVMVGSFMVPVAYVLFFYERRHLSRLTLQTVFLAFLYGGLLAVLAVSFLGPFFISQISIIETLRTGFIEEFGKILGVIVIARQRRHDSEMDGLILGAAVGMGFAALESTGYAFTAFLTSSGSISVTVAVTLFRGLFSPLAHGTWTAILASVLFRESMRCRFLINMQVIGAYVFVSVLHAMWNGLPFVIDSLFSQGLDVLIVDGIIGTIGLLVLWKRWKEAVRSQIVLPPGTDDSCV